jgi:hypothetical protein
MVAFIDKTEQGQAYARHAPGPNWWVRLREAIALICEKSR